MSDDLRGRLLDLMLEYAKVEDDGNVTSRAEVAGRLRDVLDVARCAPTPQPPPAAIEHEAKAMTLRAAVQVIVDDFGDEDGWKALDRALENFDANPVSLPYPAAVDLVERTMLRAHEVADAAAVKFGPHPSVEFTLCRLTEEVGELSAAATSRSKGRDEGRAERIRDEAADVVAMVIRLLREWPDGRTEG